MQLIGGSLPSLAIETAGADGLDPLEVEILQIFMDEWGITEDDIDEAGDLI